MSLSIVKKPERLINGHLSKWNAVHQPIEFKVQRKDQAVEMKYKFTTPGSTVRIKVVGSLPLGVEIGQRVYYSSPSQSYVLNITDIVGNILITDGLVSGTVYGGFVNFLDAYTNYFIETEILYRNTSNVYESIGTSRSKIDSQGIASININEWLKTKAVFEDDFLYNVINKAINGEGGAFTARFRENYNGQTLDFSPVDGIGYWTNSAKQVLEIFGTNMAVYVPTYDDTREERAKFLSVFEKPTYFPGYPFSLCFVYSDNLLNYQITREESTKDLNGSEIDSTSDDLNATQRFFVNRLMLKQGYTSDVKQLEVWLETGSIITESAIEEPGVGAYSDGSIFEATRPREILYTSEDLVL